MKIFEKMTEQGERWIKDMMSQLGSDDPHQALHALRAGLHALRDRLSVEEAAQLAAQLPVVIRGIFFENWVPHGKPLRIRRREEFLDSVRQHYAPREDLAAADLMRALFRVLDFHVSEGELADILLSLPQELVDVVTGYDARV